MEDSALVCRMYDNDVWAFDALYHKYHQAIYRNIFKLTKNEAVSQDILQDVFVALWEKRLLIKADQSVSGWLFVLSFNKSISHLRQVVRESSVMKSMPFTEVELAIDQMQVIDDHYFLLYQAVNQLSPQKKRVFTLCKLEGRTYEEAAETLNISKHTVKEYLGHAVVSVKNHIRENQHERKAVSVVLFCSFLDRIQ